MQVKENKEDISGKLLQTTGAAAIKYPYPLWSSRKKSTSSWSILWRWYEVLTSRHHLRKTRSSQIKNIDQRSIPRLLCWIHGQRHPTFHQALESPPSSADQQELTSPYSKCSPSPPPRQDMLYCDPNSCNVWQEKRNPSPRGVGRVWIVKPKPPPEIS
jgi:hypothetical protein